MCTNSIWSDFVKFKAKRTREGHYMDLVVLLKQLQLESEPNWWWRKRTCRRLLSYYISFERHHNHRFAGRASPTNKPLMEEKEGAGKKKATIKVENSFLANRLSIRANQIISSRQIQFHLVGLLGVIWIKSSLFEQCFAWVQQNTEFFQATKRRPRRLQHQAEELPSRVE